MLSEYIAKKLQRAQHKKLKDGTYCGEVPGLPGVWANARELEQCTEELKDVLREWRRLRPRNRRRIHG